MRIEKIEAWICHFPLPAPFAPSWVPGVPSEANSCVVYRITTSDGVQGAAAGIAVFEEAAGYVPILRAYLSGREVTSVEDILKTLRSSTQVLGYRAWHVEPALWDIIGKVAGLPVYKLLGGARDRLQAYASTGELKLPAQHVETCEQLRDLGFRAVKLRVRHPSIAEDIAVVEAVREAMGDDFTIMVDANQGWRVHGLGPYPEWDFKRALRFAQACEELDVYWLEEPLYQHDYEGYAALRGQTDVRIAGGEMLADLHPFRELLVRGGLDIVQPDVALSGGILFSRKIAILAETFGAEYAPHTWTNGLGLAANLHCMGAAANAGWCEFPFEPGSWVPEARDAMLTRTLDIDPDGAIAVPQGPGLGVEVDWEAVAAHGTEVA
ncbi:MAG TPA: mandelate racemase/muconate lactonizing enzyme family protein [Actinomycetota bacterium]|jgi:D-galactarolactone cycloisomerase|nr:mandelate racemase/muconate lactonizing enzyme family protein [Actinomycetota bacterium]